MVFDGIRSNLQYNELFTLLKDFLLLFLFMVVVSSKLIFKNRRLLNVGGSLFLLYHICIGLFTVSDIESFTIFYKTFQLFMALYVFYYMPTLTKCSCKYFVSYVLNVAIVFAILDTVLYFIPLPIWNRDTFWWGRFAVGYPTMDTITLSYVLIILLFNNYLKISSIKRSIYSIIVSVAIMMQVTGTGMLLIFLIYTTALLFSLFTFWKKQNRSLKRNIISVTILAICAFIFIPPIIKIVNPSAYDKAVTVFFTKSSYFLSKDNKQADASINTMEWREQAIKKAKEQIRSDTERVFGIGLNNFSFNPDSKKSRFITLENQYIHISTAYGYLGLSFFLLFIAIINIQVLFSGIKELSIKVMFVLSNIVFILNGFTLLSLVLYSNALFYAFMLAYFYNYRKKECHSGVD